MIKNGSTVAVHYTGKTTDGEQFDSSIGREPFQFQIGSQQVIPGFENGLIGKPASFREKSENPFDFHQQVQGFDQGVFQTGWQIANSFFVIDQALFWASWDYQNLHNSSFSVVV